MEDDKSNVSTSNDILVKFENGTSKQEHVIKEEPPLDLSSIDNTKSETFDSDPKSCIKNESVEICVGSSSEVDETFDGTELLDCKSDLIDVEVTQMKTESLMEDEKFELKDAALTCEISGSAVNNLEKKSNDPESKVTLKRKSDSLALISSYQISSESEEDIKRDAFLKPQVLSETDTETDTDSESDGLPVFNVESDAASESGDEGVSSGVKQKKSSKSIKAPGELDIDDLPPIKDLQISVKEEECLPFGKVHSIVETLVVIEALPDVPAINLESVLFTKIGQPLGEIFDVFGPVKRPYYTIRFNNRDEIESKSLSVGTLVYCAPKTKYTQYVFIHQLAKMKGSDASWKGDMEPPPGYEEYSDDEEERRAKKERKESRMKALAQDIVDLDEPARKVPSFEERMNRQNTMRNQLFSNHHTAPLKRPDWFRNAAPGAGRPMPDGEGSSKGNVVRASNFTVPPFHRQAPPTPPSFPFSSSNSFRTSPPGGRTFSIRNNQMQSKFFSNPSTSKIFPPQNQMNGNPFSPSRPQASYSPNGQAFPANSQGFQSANSGFQANVQNFSPQNSQASQRNASPFRPVVGGFSTCNQSWSCNSHTFGGQPSFSANTHSFPSPSLCTATSPGFPQNHPCKHRNFDNQGLQSNSQQFPLNNSCGTGNFQQNGFMPDNPPFPQIFPPNCSKYPPQPGQNFQPPQRPGNVPFGLPNSRSFIGTSPSFQSQNHFSSPNPQASQFLQNNQFFPTNMPSFQQPNPPFSQGCRSFPPK